MIHAYQIMPLLPLEERAHVKYRLSLFTVAHVVVVFVR